MRSHFLPELLKSEDLTPVMALSLYLEGWPIQYSDEDNSGKWFTITEGDCLACLTKRKLRIGQSSPGFNETFHKVFWDILA
jgi:hypothetical protein